MENGTERGCKIRIFRYFMENLYYGKLYMNFKTFYDAKIFSFYFHELFLSTNIMLEIKKVRPKKVSILLLDAQNDTTTL